MEATQTATPRHTSR